MSNASGGTSNNTSVSKKAEIFIKSKVHQELRNRVRRANSPITPPVPGATCESADAPHRLNAGQVQREVNRVLKG